MVINSLISLEKELLLEVSELGYGRIGCTAYSIKGSTKNKIRGNFLFPLILLYKIKKFFMIAIRMKLTSSIITIILILFTLTSCKREEQGRLLIYDKGTGT